MKSGGKIQRSPQNSPESPAGKRTKLENSPLDLPPKLSNDEEQNQKRESDAVCEQTENVETEQICPEATPENLDTLPGEHVTLSSSVLEIPEFCRANFGIPDFWRLDDCKIGKSFWYDENHGNHVKYFIVLHNDEGCCTQWDTTRQFTLKEQIGLQIPQTFKLCFMDILQRIGDGHRKGCKTRVWLDVRDFCLLFNADFDACEGNPIVKIKSIEKLVTHFTFGGRLYSETRLEAENLLSFILVHFKNVEYLCIQDEMLQTKSSRGEIKVDPSVDKTSLSHLKTIRLAHSRSVFSFQFLVQLMQRCPKLENMYEIPLHLLHEIDQAVKDIHKDQKSIRKFKSLIRSVYTSRNHYAPYRASPYFLEDLSIFSGRGKTALSEWSTRTFFIYCFRTRTKCLEVMSKILKENVDTIQKLAIEPPFEDDHGQMHRLHFPVMKNCTSLQVHMMRQRQMAQSFFSRDFDPSKKFPNLTHFEITVDKRSITENSRPYPTFGKRSLWSLFDEHFPTHLFHEGFETVRFLALLHFSPYEVMPRMAELFPNLRVLRLANGLVDVISVLHLCYKHWPKLQQLILEINNDTKFGNLDSAFTGIAMETVKTLSETVDPNSADALNIIAKNRIKLPISHLKDLQLLKIILRSSGFNSTNMKPIFTPFSIFFGFDGGKMPRVKIQLCFGDRVSNAEKSRLLQSLESVLPYIELDD